MARRAQLFTHMAWTNQYCININDVYAVGLQCTQTFVIQSFDRHVVPESSEHLNKAGWQRRVDCFKYILLCITRKSIENLIINSCLQILELFVTKE